MSNDISEEDSRTIQYAIHGGGYVRCGQTRKTVPAGFYDVRNFGMGNFGLTPKSPVSDELIDMKGTVADDIILDIEKFMATGPRYARYGLTHKRGYLLYGPPGSGKTSLGLIVARRFIDRVNGVVMYVSDETALCQGVAIMRDVEPGRPSMYLIEEADNIVDDTDCLSILDGEMSINGAVFVAMTNYKERLAQRICNRPGRFDRVELVDRPPAPIQIEYLRRVIARGDEANALSQAEYIVNALSGVPISMAHLREAFISHVLMDMPIADVRARFEAMAGMRDDKDDEDSEDDDDDDDFGFDDDDSNDSFSAPDFVTAG